MSDAAGRVGSVWQLSQIAEHLHPMIEVTSVTGDKSLLEWAGGREESHLFARHQHNQTEHER